MKYIGFYFDKHFGIELHTGLKMNEYMNQYSVRLYNIRIGEPSWTSPESIYMSRCVELPKRRLSI